jgi:hypothetical protein
MLRTLVIALVFLGCAAPLRAQSAPEHRPRPPRPDVVVVVDPSALPDPAEIEALQNAAAYYSRPVYLDENDWRLPSARRLHDRIRFGKPDAPPPPPQAAPTNAQRLGTWPGVGGLLAD